MLAIIEHKILSSVKTGPKDEGFGELAGLRVKLWFWDPKRHTLAWNTLCDVGLLCIKIGVAVLVADVLKNTPHGKKQPSQLWPRGAKSRMHKNETAYPIWMKFCMLVVIPKVINCAILVTIG